MKNFKRITGAFLGVAVSLGITTATPAIAATIDEVVVDEVISRNVKPPKSEADLPYTATLDDIYAQHGTYTAYSFRTSTGNFNLTWDLEAIRPYSGNRSMTITVYKKNTFNWSIVSNQSQSITFKDSGEGEISFTGLDTDELYCIRFDNTSQENSSTSLHNSISGTFVITD